MVGLAPVLRHGSRGRGGRQALPFSVTLGFWVWMQKEEGSSFLKKRTKKPLSVVVRACGRRAPQPTKVFASFSKKKLLLAYCA
jgi:hypothetical protein